jgi:hypothetical protein
VAAFTSLSIVSSWEKKHMPRMTAKYRTALKLAEAILDHPFDPNDQKVLYRRLGEHNYFFDSKSKVWEKGEPANPPTDLVRVRVWAKAEHIEQVADKLVSELSDGDYRLIERSEPYPCRPPKQLESRVYLTFLPNTAE